MKLLTETDRAAYEALQKRQGGGARYDAENAPAEDLLLARRGAAFFARKLNEMSDTELDAVSLRGDRTRRHLIAETSLWARSTALALKGLREELTDEEAGWEPDIAMATTLPARALRYLYAHSDVHLNVEFRDLSSEHWDEQVAVAASEALAVRSLPRARASQLWQGAVKLGTGARTADIPTDVRRVLDAATGEASVGCLGTD